MRETMGESGRLSCADAAMLLEKRVVEETLSAREQSALQQHLNHCMRCRRLVNWVSALPGLADELSDIEVNLAYRAAMKKRSFLQRTEPLKKVAIAAAAAAAVMAAITLDRDWLHAVFSNKDEVADGMLECEPAMPTAPVPGVMMTYCKNRKPGMLIENGGDVRVLLPHGAVGMRIDPNRRQKHKVTVETPQGEVRVKGTVFTVQVDKNNTWLEVFRGGVDFVPVTVFEEPMYVTAGRGADLRRHEVFALSAPRTDVLLQALEAKTALKDALNQTHAQESMLNTPSSSANLESSEPAEAPRPVTGSGQQAPTGQSAEAEGSVRSGKATLQKHPQPSIDALIQNAQSCLIAHDWPCASSHYQDILKRYPGRPESTAILISLAKIELRHLNRPKKALDHYRAYQQRAPDGPMAEEALFGIAETYRRLGREEREESTLRLFVESYPGSSQLKRARARLRQLSPRNSL